MTPSRQTLTGRVALVTGATRGIGRAAAEALGAAGAHVIAVGRTQGALEELDDAIQAADGQRATLVPMDLAKGDGIDQLGLAIFERHRRLDVLVHAAAMLGGLRPVAHIPPVLWDRIMATNLTCVFRLIFLTSGRAERPKAFWGSYAATKAGLEALVRCWADEVDSSNIRAVLLDPGVMRTKMRAEAFPGEDKALLTDPAEIGPLIVELAQASDPGPPTRTVKFSDWAAARVDAAPGTP
jgi:NAD(P)-dependent dehydrogenase (short-subunit alcohol dehydrogenase family)